MGRVIVQLSTLPMALTFGLKTFAQESALPQAGPVSSTMLDATQAQNHSTTPLPGPAPSQAPAPAEVPASGEMGEERGREARDDLGREKEERKAEMKKRKAERKREKKKHKAEKRFRKRGHAKEYNGKDGDRQKD